MKSIEEYVKEIVDHAPPLTSEQIDKLRIIFTEAAERIHRASEESR